ncbi:glycerol-3-phosphate 1-O-acyltransferase PlsY [uncultured Solobacterium sp.]|uniref:glycerol-3-phosphate 1-O-acyltransferase PlsY n=1 Tax=uncultured Solobacterium sp. TaxID=747375 RepID=UPI0028DB79A9|nr:glycerol-3-phosphate 1-O-acyltransferase PlsY [uncultured Solobacterium sp.]
MLNFIGVIILSYLFGSIPWSLVIGKVFFHKDIRTEGSGNLGGTNAGRVLGKKVGIIVIVLDALKAFFSMLLASYIAKDAMIYAGLACCIGHCFPIFAQFKGGKAVATSFGFFLSIATFINHQYFFQFFLPLLVFLVSLYLCRMVSLSSMIGLGSSILISFFIGNPLSITLSIFVLWLFVVYRHRANIERIKNGTESKIKWMGKSLWEK